MPAAIIAAGAMGAAIGQRLGENGVTILTVLAGRSRASCERAEAAGMRAVADADIADCDIPVATLPCPGLMVQPFSISRTWSASRALS